MATNETVPKLLSKSDIAKRWEISRQLLTHRLKGQTDFPEPAAYIHNGKTPLFRAEDIIAFEKTKMRKEGE